MDSEEEQILVDMQKVKVIKIGTGYCLTLHWEEEEEEEKKKTF
jgi:hypothetical protein